MSLNERVGTPVYGTDSPATARTRSGRISAEFQTIGAPQSWPTITAGSPGLSASMAPATSATMCCIE